jgi:site-specific DNA-methyltransferase (adenine-specific)
MDCVEAMKRLPDKCIDLTVTSPPYDNLRTYNGNIDQWNFGKFKEIARELYRVTKEGGVVVWIVADATIKGSETGTSFKQALFFKECGFNIHDTMIWNKGELTFPCPSRYHSCFEYMFIFSKGKPKSTNLIEDRKNICGGHKVHGTDRQANGKTTTQKGVSKGRTIKEIGKRFNVWSIPSCKSNAERTGHPAQFPIQLAKDHIISWSNEGDIVLDPFMGSGTTGVACLETNRRFIGIELDEEYFEIAKNRIGETHDKRVHNQAEVAVLE